MNNIESIIKRIADDAQAQAQQKIDEAQAVTDQLVIDVPEEQEVWMLCLRLAVMRRDGDEVHRVINAIDKQHVYLSADNREKLAFWRDGEEAR